MHAHGHVGELRPALTRLLVWLQATHSLLREALKDPLNKRFVLLSETCNPLLPAATVYAQLMAESKSRINACAMSDKNRNVERCAHLPAVASEQGAASCDVCCCDGKRRDQTSRAGLQQPLGRCRMHARAWKIIMRGGFI